MEGWNTTWLSMPNNILVETQKYQEVVHSQEKLIIVEESFLDIGKQMLKTSYILNLGQLLKIARVKKISLIEIKTKKNSEYEWSNHRETS
jgi:ribosomal protein L21